MSYSSIYSPPHNTRHSATHTHKSISELFLHDNSVVHSISAKFIRFAIAYPSVLLTFLRRLHAHQRSGTTVRTDRHSRSVSHLNRSTVNSLFVSRSSSRLFQRKRRLETHSFRITLHLSLPLTFSRSCGSYPVPPFSSSLTNFIHTRIRIRVQVSV